MNQLQNSPITFDTDYKYVLHVGCGPKRAEKLHSTFHTDEWKELRVDLNPAVQPDIIANIISMPQIPDNAVDAIWTSHNIEHLYAHEVPIAFKEFLRVLKPGGFLLATMPDLQKAAAYIAQGKLEEPIYQSPAGPISALDICFGFGASIARGNYFMAHRTGFSPATLRQKLINCGYENVRVDSKNLDLWATAYKPQPVG
jgi:SAM-dependent methyltransferase